MFKHAHCFMIHVTFQMRTIAIIAEGIPENMTRKLVKIARSKNISIIGPATVNTCKIIHLKGEQVGQMGGGGCGEYVTRHGVWLLMENVQPLVTLD